MLKWCVLVGLDWAKPMMFLLLHVTCSCIHSIFFPYLIDIDLCWYFSVCHSLSLFLSVSCSMAPKRKSTPSQNPLRSGASSSSSPIDSTPSHVQFRDEKACMDFLENFSRHSIHLECQVVLSDFSDTDLPIFIYSRGWESLCGISITCPSVIIQEFYSNMHRFDYSVPHFFSLAFGVRAL